MSESDAPDRPSPAAGVLGKTEILSYIGEVADELGVRGLTGSLVVVGGSYMALRDLRESPMDVDSVTRLAQDFRAVVRTIADRHGLRSDWLNDSAAGFTPAGLRVEDCEVLYEHKHLTLLGPPSTQVILMKLLAGRTADHDDMVALWPSCRFVNAQSAVDAYYVAYPFEEHDPYLVDYVQQIADLAAATE
jgi:hypothetical protein